MTRIEAIERWYNIIPTVFAAENNIREQLQEMVANEPDKELARKNYVYLVAEEIVRTATDAELAKIK